MSDLPAKREQRMRLDRLDTEPDILTALCERVAEGVSLVDVAHDYGVSLRRLGKWLEDTAHPERLLEWEFARRCFADRIATETVGIADEQRAVEKGKPGSGEFYDPDVARDTLRVSTRLKVAAKLDRARYGETVKHEHSGAVVMVDAGLVGTAVAMLNKRLGRDVTAESLRAAEDGVQRAEMGAYATVDGPLPEEPGTPPAVLIAAPQATGYPPTASSQDEPVEAATRYADEELL